MDDPTRNDLPEHLEDALGDVLWRDPATRDEAFEALVKAHPEHEAGLRSRRAFLLEEEDVMFDDQTAIARELDLTGEILSGKYRILKLRGEGGFGSVYEAVDEMLGATVAVKVLRLGKDNDRDVLDRFVGEAKVLTNLDHPNVVRWITFDKTDAGLHYFVMEYLAGEELSEILKRERQLAPDRALEMLLQITSALCAAHKLPDGTALLHLDLKPQNVFVLHGEPERIKVIDFGISQHVGAEARAAAGIGAVRVDEDVEGLDLTATLTSALSIDAPSNDPSVIRARGGTLLYASPEQCKHLAGMPDIVALDGRSDIYSLGIMAFQMLTGELPYTHKPTPLAALHAHLQQEPRKLSSLGIKVPRKLEAFVEKCLAKDREDRFETIEEAHAALDRIANPPSVWPRVAAIVAVLVLAALPFLLPDSNLAPFDVQLPGDFGPFRDVRNLTVTSLASTDPSADVSIVADKQTNRPALEGWEAKFVRGADGLELEVRAPDGAASVDELVYFATDGSGKTQYSQQVRVVYVGASDWSITSCDVPGRDGRHLDAYGAILEVEVSGQSASRLDRVEVRYGDVTRLAVRDESRESVARVYYTIPLDKFENLPKSGKARLAVSVQDLADRTESRVLELVLDTRPFEFTAKLTGLGCRAISARERKYVVSPGSKPILETEPSNIDPRPRRVSDEVFELERVANGYRISPEGTKAYSGEIRVDANDPRTFHPDPSRASASVLISFNYETDPATASVDVPGAQSEPADDGIETYYTNLSEASLRLQRGDVYVTALIHVTGASTSEEPTRIELHRNDQVVTLPLPLPSDGSHEVRVEVYRHFEGTTELPDEAETTVTCRIVKDTIAPTLELENTIGDRTDPRKVISPATLTVRDPSPSSSHPSPLIVSYRLERVLSSGERELVRDIERRIGRGEPTPLEWNVALQHEADALGDGRYELTATCKDLAGNRSESPEQVIAWSVARVGPELEFDVFSNPWEPVAGDQFVLRIQARDPNGVESVRCMAHNDASGKSQPIELTPRSRDTTSAQWESKVTFPEDWSRQDIRLECVAVDAHGRKNSEPHNVRLGEFTRQRPGRIRMKPVGAEDVAAMRLITGDRYTFRGRREKKERALFQRFDLELGNRETDEIDTEVLDFYLDETEVTVAQFAAFLTAAQGYENGEHWPTGSEPDTARKATLIAKLARLDPSLPVTEIDWFEASAYAAWVGKRLPTHLEWEYAVRGGTSYRPFSAAVEGRELDRRAFHASRDSVDDYRPWPVARGVDRTTDGLRNLCSNVSEWTSTAGRRSRFVVAGASYESATYDFLRFEAQPPNKRLLRIGFRCAADVDTVDAQLEAGADARFHAEILTDPNSDRG